MSSPVLLYATFDANPILPAIRIIGSAIAVNPQKIMTGTMTGKIIRNITILKIPQPTLNATPRSLKNTIRNNIKQIASNISDTSVLHGILYTSFLNWPFRDH
jgi:hypothetical protein